MYIIIIIFLDNTKGKNGDLPTIRNWIPDVEFKKLGRPYYLVTYNLHDWSWDEVDCLQTSWLEVNIQPVFEGRFLFHFASLLLEIVQQKQFCCLVQLVLCDCDRTNTTLCFSLTGNSFSKRLDQALSAYRQIFNIYL